MHTYINILSSIGQEFRRVHLEVASIRAAERPDRDPAARVRAGRFEALDRVQSKDHGEAEGSGQQSHQQDLQREDAGETGGRDHVAASNTDRRRAPCYGDKLHVGQRDVEEIHRVRVTVHRRRSAEVQRARFGQDLRRNSVDP